MRLVLVTACALALDPTAQPQAVQVSRPGPTSPAPTVSSTVVQAIQAAADRVNVALERRDRPALEQLLAASFAWVHQADGRVDSREAWLANAARGVALAGQRSVRSEHGVEVAAHGVGAAQGPRTVVRIARVQLLDAAASRETWLRQTQVFIASGDAGWQLAFGQGTLMYAGPILDPDLHARYGGTYVIDADRTLVLRWEDAGLLAFFPNGQTAQIFLSSPTEEAARTVDTGRLHFTLGADGTPLTAALRQGNREVWRAARKAR